MNLLEYYKNNKKYSHLITEWDPSNGSMEDYTYASHKKVKWNCSKIEHHTWRAQIASRTRKKISQ